MNDDIWVLHYQGRLGILPLTEKGREWLSIHGQRLKPHEVFWTTDEDFVEMQYQMTQDGLSILEGMDDRKGPDA